MWLNISKILFFLYLSFGFSGSLLFPGNGATETMEGTKDTGFKYSMNYTPEEYGSAPQNWCILQDRLGIIYAANQDDFLEYDGVSWRSIDIPNQSVRSIAIDDNGTIYIGGNNEIGFLAPDSKGKLQYVSLVKHLDEDKRNFGIVWRTHSTKEGIYFRTSTFLFRWNPNYKQFKVWEPVSIFIASFTNDGKYFIHQQDVGMMHIVGDSLEMIPGGERFAGFRIYMMVPYDSQHLLVGTRSKGFYLYDGMNIIPFPIEVDDYVKKMMLSHGVRLSSRPGEFALATLRGGLVIIDSRGRLKHIFNKNSGLQDENVKYVFEDFQGNLWLALVKGISKIEYDSPFSVHDDRSHLPGLVLSVVRHRNQLYAGTTSGLYLLDSANKFREIPDVSTNCWFLLSVDEALLAATSQGVFQLGNKDSSSRIWKIIDNNSYILEPSRQDPSRLWVGTRQGLFSLYLKKDQWAAEHRFKNITQEIRTIAEDQKGNLWLGIRAQGVLHVDSSTHKNSIHPGLTAARYDTSHGLPAKEVHVFMAAGHIIFATEDGIFRFHEGNNTFIPDTTLGSEFAGGPDGKSVFRIVEGKNKHIWLHSKRRNIQAVPQPDGTFILNSKPFLRLFIAQVNTIYPDPNGHIIWFASNKGLVCFDTTVKKNYDLDFPTLIRRVQLINDKTLVFDGNRLNVRKDAKPFFPTLEYIDRNLRIEFVAPFFEDESSILYQYFLEGYDDRWSGWTLETKKDYTNLDDGVYTFRVRAKNIYENLSREATFQFKVLPPWYQTWWAYLIYAFLAFLGVYLIVKWRSWKLVREKQKLEQVIRERTKEINEKNLQLEEQSEKLKEMDQIKSRFFANISHEFRTPLTLIMGPIEQRLSLCRDKQQQKELQMMLRNSQRLLSLINQLLDLSKLDSGKMKLQAARQNIIPFLKGLVGSFESLVVQKPLDLTLQTEEENILLYYDPEKLEKVICNLVANAVKFTPSKGKIIVSVKTYNAMEKDYPGGYLEISFRDTGIGIPAGQLPYIFDRFYQADDSLAHEHHQKGSGIGLALVKELVNLHHGDISVHSSEKKGTKFIIRLPLGKAHLKPDEIFENLEPVEVVKSEALLYRREQTQPWEVPTDDMIEKEENRVEKPESDEPGEEEKNVILVVDDSADVRAFIKSSLEPFYTIVEAADGREGIDKARAIIPDLIVSDVMMPNVDGFELCRELKTDIKTSHIPVVLLTAKASEESIIEGLETGADDYITKPFNTKILLTRIKNLIDLRCQLQEKIQREMMLHPTEMAVSSMDQEFMQELKKSVEKNMADEEFGVDELANGLYMSRATLNRKLRALTGESTNQFIQSYRLKRAAQLLKTNFGNVTEVAFEVGFSNSAYFTKCFKEKFHQLPHTFQASESEHSPRAAG